MKVIMYGADWCPDCNRNKHFLEEHNIEYEYINIEENPEAVEKIEELNEKIGKGKSRIIPTIVIDNKIILSEPTNEELAKALKLS